VFSVFQKPIFEVLHLACHIPSFIFSNEKVHSYQSHDKEIHSHENLTALYITTDENGELPQPPNESDTKKKIEIGDKNSSTLKSSILVSKNDFHINIPFQSVFIKRPNPPPQLSKV
jgi:hypothetical protein